MGRTEPLCNVVAETDRAALLLDPIRLQILEELREPESAAGLSRRLGIPRQKINYHLRELEKRSFVELVEERRKGNCTERIVRATARSFLISPTAVGDLATDPAEIADRFSAEYLVALAARAVGDLGTLQKKAATAKKRLATISLQTEVRFANAAARNAFAEELAGEIARLVAKYNDQETPGGRRFRFFLGGYPTPPRGSQKTREDSDE